MIARRLRWPPDARQMVRQLTGAWLCGSVLMGTVAWGFLSSEATAVPVPVAGRVPLEASGGVTLATLAAIAETGVDRISMGALTHSAMPADLGMDLLP